MMHSGDWPNSISGRDYRVTASQQLFSDLAEREATRGEVTFDEIDRRYADPISREELTALLPFIIAFCEGRTVWAYEMKTRHDRPMPTWTPITEWDAHFKPHCLSLEYRTDNPFAEQL
jgi:hypothetical protein